jgi:hypothetical protein
MRGNRSNDLNKTEDLEKCSAAPPALQVHLACHWIRTLTKATLLNEFVAVLCDHTTMS